MAQYSGKGLVEQAAKDEIPNEFRKNPEINGKVVMQAATVKQPKDKKTKPKINIKTLIARINPYNYQKVERKINNNLVSLVTRG